MIHLAACLAGFGGLLLEIVWLRRHGLLLGNTAAASACVLAIFLLGLGVGGLYLPRTRAARRRPLAVGALLYGAVAVLAVLGDTVLASLPPLGLVQGFVLALLLPGIPAVLMGGAFPLLFSVIERHAPAWRSAVLCGVNLFGAVLATFLGGNFVIPDLGMTTSSWLGGAAYGASGLLVALASRGQRPVADAAVPPLPGIGRAEVLALASGFVVLGLEIVMLRRLPFFLDGFQPTLSGVLAGCLLGLTLGSFFGPALICRLCGGRESSPGRAAAVSVLLGVLALALGLHESLAPWLGRLPVTSAVGFHLRIVAAALVAAGPACFCLGATIPLCLAEFHHPETRAPLAGRLFFFQGIGALAGALTAGQVLPRALPESYFLYGLPVVSAVGLLLVLRAIPLGVVCGLVLLLVLTLSGVTGGTALRHADAPVAGSRYDHKERYRYLDHRTDDVLTASVVYDRRTHGLILFTDEFRAAYIGPDSGYMKVLGHLPFLLRKNLSRVAVVALGTGTTANAVRLWPDPKELHVVEISPAVLSLVDHFAKDGPGQGFSPAPFSSDRRTRVHVTDGRRFIARREKGSLDLISMEPLLPYAPGTVPLYTREFYALCQDALSDDGLIVQWVPTHSMPKEYFETLLATFARSFEHHSAWLLNHSTLLIGSKTPHLPPLESIEARLRDMPGPARRDLHEAGVATLEDFAAAFVTDDVLRVTKDAVDLTDDRPFLENIGYWSAATRQAFLPDNLLVLHRTTTVPTAWPGPRDWRNLRGERLSGLADLAAGAAATGNARNALAVLALGRAFARMPSSVLLHGELARARRELTRKQLLLELSPPNKFDRAAYARRIDRRRLVAQLDRDPSGAFLWAVRALVEAKELDQHAAAFRALAQDPTVYDRWPQLLVPWIQESEIEGYRGPFEAMVTLPDDRDLVTRAAADTPEAIALQARFRVRVGHATVAMLAHRSLRPAEIRALRAVVDPALLARAQRNVCGRDGDLAREILPIWRRDLRAPKGLKDLLRGTVPQREALATALSGRKAELDLLGQLLLDSELAVRRVAGVSLYNTVGDQVSYDPQWQEARRRRAVRELRELRRKP